MGNVSSSAGGWLMVLVSRADRSSGMFSTTAANAIRPDNRARGSKGPFPLVCVRVKGNKRDVKPHFAPRHADPYRTQISNHKKAFNQ